MSARQPLLLSYEEESHQWCRLIAGTIIRVRKERRWSQGKLGAKVGLTQKQISVLESDPDAMHIGRLYGVLLALGLSLVLQPSMAGDMALQRRRRTDRNAANDKVLEPAA